MNNEQKQYILRKPVTKHAPSFDSLKKNLEPVEGVLEEQGDTNEQNDIIK